MSCRLSDWVSGTTAQAGSVERTAQVGVLSALPRTRRATAGLGRSPRPSIIQSSVTWIGRCRSQVGASMRSGHAGAPDGDAHEQEQPDDVDEVPIPGGRLEAEVLLGCEMARQRAEQAHGEEQGADDDVRAVEAGGHEESGAVDVAGILEAGMRVLVGLAGGEQD